MTTAKDWLPCLYDEWFTKFKAAFEAEHGRPLTNLEIWIAGNSYNAGKDRADNDLKIERDIARGRAAGHAITIGRIS